MKHRYGMKWLIVFVCMFVVLSNADFTVLASNNSDLNGSDVISIELPVMEEAGSAFDFIMDPQGLINATNAVKYGGRSFEPGATIYFENRSGEYDFSHMSDWVNITNRGSVPVRVTIKAQMQNVSDVIMAENEAFNDEKAKQIYLAIVDSQGNTYPLAADGTVVVQTEIDAVREDAYSCYMFRLTGACNSKGDWHTLKVKPHIVVEWKIELLADEMQEEMPTEVPAVTPTVSPSSTPIILSATATPADIMEIEPTSTPALLVEGTPTSTPMAMAEATPSETPVSVEMNEETPTPVVSVEETETPTPVVDTPAQPVIVEETPVPMSDVEGGVQAMSEQEELSAAEMTEENGDA